MHVSGIPHGSDAVGSGQFLPLLNTQNARRKPEHAEADTGMSELERMLAEALDDFDEPMPTLPRPSSPIAARQFATPPSLLLPIPPISTECTVQALKAAADSPCCTASSTSTKFTIEQPTGVGSQPAFVEPVGQADSRKPLEMHAMEPDVCRARSMRSLEQPDALRVALLMFLESAAQADPCKSLDSSCHLRNTHAQPLTLSVSRSDARYGQLYNQNGALMIATNSETARTAYHCLSSAEWERRKRHKRNRRARLKQLAVQQAAKQARRRTLSGGKQRHKQDGVRKKSAANRRRSAERASSWVRNHADSFSDDDDGG